MSCVTATMSAASPLTGAAGRQRISVHTKLPSRRLRRTSTLAERPK
jgi:hypothetical protein